MNESNYMIGILRNVFIFLILRGDSMKKEWNKYNLASAMIAGMNVLSGIVMYFLLDNEIAIQWRGGVPTSIVSKNYIFLFPLLAVFFFISGKIILRFVSYKWFKDVKQILVDYFNMFLQIIFVTCQLYVILYAFGLRITIESIFFIEIIIGCVFGMKLIKKDKRH